MIMFPPWRFRLREAQVAFDQGRLDEAAAAVAEGALRQYLPVRQLAGQIGEQLSRRALERAAAGDLASAWRDLDQARALAGETPAWLRLQQAVAEIAVADIVQHLEAGDFAGATRRLGALEQRHVPGVGLATLREVIQRLQSAATLSQKGKFAEAQNHLAAAAALAPVLPVVSQRRHEGEQRAARYAGLEPQLHAALAAGDWSAVLAVASELLTIAPDCRLAHEARKRAWLKVGQQDLGNSRRLAETEHWSSERLVRAERAAGESTPAARARPAPRFMLWIDGVGGYLVCLGDEITLGQAQPGTRVEIPIQADLSRKHAVITRHGEGYILDAVGGAVAVGGRKLVEPHLLADGDEIVLSRHVQLRFRKPHVLSNSARLEIMSGHRTLPHADAVLLMAESCVLGPKRQNHVVCRDWSSDVVLFRADERLLCRALGAIEIDGELHEGRGPVRPGSHVSGSDFSLTLEAV